MYALITLCWPNSKKEPFVWASKVFDRSVKDATYGGDLMYSGRYEDTDRDLRRLVTECLYHAPNSRPTLKELEVTIKDKVRQSLDKSEEEVRAWAKRFYGEPERRPRPAVPPPPPPPAAAGAAAARRWEFGAGPPPFGGPARARFGRIYSDESVVQFRQENRKRADEDVRPLPRFRFRN